MQRLRGLGVRLLLLIIGGMIVLALLVTTQMIVSLFRTRDQTLRNATAGLEEQSRNQLPLLHEQLTARIQERLITISESNLTISRALLTASSQPIIDADYASSIPLTTLPNGVRADTRPGRITSVLIPAGADAASAAEDMVFSALLDTLLPQQLLTKRQGILAVSYVGPSGLMRLYPSVDTSQQDFTLEQALRERFASASQPPAWLPPFTPPAFINTVDRHITALVTPIYDAGVFQGIVISYVSLGSLTADLIGIQPTPDSWVFVLGPDRQLIATSERFVSFLTDQSAPAGSQVLTVTRTISPDLDRIIGQMVAGEQGLETVALADRPYLLTYRPIVETDWSLALAVPLDELTRSAGAVAENIRQTAQDTLRSTLLTTFLVLTVMVLLGSYFARRLTRPLGELAAAARAIAHGTYTQEVAVRSRDEIGEVAEAFNLMSRSITASQEQLQAANRQLEETVHERTADLEETVGQLQASLARQTDLDRQLRHAATPLIPVVPGVLLMPLIGALDAQRMADAAQSLLEQLEKTAVREVILDVTGVPTITSEVALALVELATALRLMGAKTILTGINPEVVQTLVSMGADLGGIQPVASLQSAVAIAFRRTVGRKD
jgi:anti-anti-sigma regulatory factor/HAMP domain-containing protein